MCRSEGSNDSMLGNLLQCFGVLNSLVLYSAHHLVPQGLLEVPVDLDLHQTSRSRLVWLEVQAEVPDRHAQA